MRTIKYILILSYFLYSCDDSDPLTTVKKPPEDTSKEDTTIVQNTSDFSIATWNVEFFPKANNTVSLMNELIANSDLDIIAFQEINSEASFNQLDDLLTNYKGVFVDVNFDLDYAFLIKSALISVFETTTILTGDGSAFPRAPAVLSFNLNNEQYRIINIHLKCCGDSESRRKDAANKLYSFIQANYPNDHVIVLGDFNDDIYDADVFDIFLNDPDNFLFADLAIQNGPTTLWSYPSWPSHLDHILVSDEFFDYDIQTETWTVDKEVSSYFNNISDHRPVRATFSFE
ncbi:MAG: endonuclease/exonuclease/phosphatase family metal-dependent hydrolase [Cyclobacteriaceae bacterium]|jgi:endonuclease/exonuclease/phosphatase family metal-dependent hydrolase